MKVVINSVVYDANLIPVTLIWDSDEARKTTAQHLTNMEDRTVENDGPRFYAMYPNTANGHKVLDDAKDAYEDYTGKPIAMTW